eukprot:1138703-Pelagomonas_calceolata.AAC.5
MLISWEFTWREQTWGLEHPTESETLKLKAVLTLLVVEGLELQSFSYHPALFLIARPVFFLCLPYFSQSELRGGVVIRSVHQCGPLSLTDVG